MPQRAPPIWYSSFRKSFETFPKVSKLMRQSFQRRSEKKFLEKAWLQHERFLMVFARVCVGHLPGASACELARQLHFPRNPHRRKKKGKKYEHKQFLILSPRRRGNSEGRSSAVEVGCRESGRPISATFSEIC